MSGEWELFVRDETGKRVAQLSLFDSAVLVPRFCDVGTWQVSADLSPAALRLTQRGYGIEFVRDGEIVMSGPAVQRTRVFNAERDGIDFVGVDDNVWLRRRLAHPEPTTASPPFDTQAYDVRTGKASTVLMGYVDANVGPGASTAGRDVDGFALASDPEVGVTVTGRARWQVLIDLMRELAQAGGVGFRVRGLTFEVYEPADRTASVVFSPELGNMAEFTYTEDAPQANVVIAGGQGEGTDRLIGQYVDSASIDDWGRIETFIDRRDIDDSTELDQAGTVAVAEGSDKTALAFIPLETPNMRYLVDYDLGDRVSAVIDGTRITDVVREVEIRLTGDEGEVMVPTIGDPEARADRPRFFGSLTRLARAVRNLERS